MSITRIYSIYKHNNNKCLIIIIIIINFHIYTKNKREKSHMMLNFLVRLTGYQLLSRADLRWRQLPPHKN